MTTLSTTDYSMFKFDDRNRRIQAPHVEQLINQIKEKNLLEAYPILVTSDMLVLDGQHRLRAAESLGVPIYYTVSSTATLDDVPEINVSTLHWSLEDYFRRWVLDGHPEYVKLQKFIDDFPFLSLAQSIELCYFGNRLHVRHLFKIGKYTTNDERWARVVCGYILDFKPYISHWNHRWFVAAISMLAANDNYDHKRMMEKMEYLSTRLIKCPDTETYIFVLNEIYNYRTTKAHRVELRRLNPQEKGYRTDRRR